MKTLMRRGRTKAEDVGEPDADQTIEIVAQPEPDAPELLVPLPAWRERANRLLEPESPTLTYAGLILIALGFALIAYTWSKVAGLLAIPLQLPYMISGGLTAIAIIVIGAALIMFDSSRRDAARRDARLEELAGAMNRIREAMEGRDE